MPLTELEYWRDRRTWAIAHTELWTRGKFVSGPLVGILAYFLQWELDFRLMVPTLQFIMTLVCAYFLVALSQLVLNWGVYAPVALERERLDELARIRAENDKLTNPDNPVSIQFDSLEFGNRGPSPVIILRLKILNRHVASTLHEIRLCSDSDRKLRLPPAHNGFDQRAMGVDFIRIESGDVRHSYLEFNGSGHDLSWSFEYSDAFGREHRDAIPASKYSKT